MSHPVFRTAQIMPLSSQAQVTTTTTTTQKQPLPCPFARPVSPVPKLGPLLPPVCGKVVRRGGGVVAVRCSSASAYEPAAVDGSRGGESRALLERCFQAPSSSGSGDFGPVMKGGQFGAFGAVTLEKGKLDMTQKQSQSSPEVCLFLSRLQFAIYEFPVVCCLRNLWSLLLSSLCVRRHKGKAGNENVIRRLWSSESWNS